MQSDGRLVGNWRAPRNGTFASAFRLGKDASGASTDVVFFNPGSRPKNALICASVLKPVVTIWL